MIFSSPAAHARRTWARRRRGHAAAGVGGQAGLVWCRAAPRLRRGDRARADRRARRSPRDRRRLRRAAAAVTGEPARAPAGPRTEPDPQRSPLFDAQQRRFALLAHALAGWPLRLEHCGLPMDAARLPPAVATPGTVRVPADPGRAVGDEDAVRMLRLGVLREALRANDPPPRGPAWRQPARSEAGVPARVRAIVGAGVGVAPLSRTVGGFRLKRWAPPRCALRQGCPRPRRRLLRAQRPWATRGDSHGALRSPSASGSPRRGAACAGCTSLRST